MTQDKAEKAQGLAGVLDVVRSLNLQDLDYELRCLQGIKEWALDHFGIDYRAGDHVRIVKEIPCSGGWAPYSECLHVGATGVVNRIGFVPGFADRPGRWQADFVPDREWSVSDFPVSGGRRYWHGPVSDTPEGYEPPGKYDTENCPEGRRHTFMFRLDWLTAVTDDDRSLPPTQQDPR